MVDLGLEVEGGWLERVVWRKYEEEFEESAGVRRVLRTFQLNLPFVEIGFVSEGDNEAGKRGGGDFGEFLQEGDIDQRQVTSVESTAFVGVLSERVPCRSASYHPTLRRFSRTTLVIFLDLSKLSVMSKVLDDVPSNVHAACPFDLALLDEAIRCHEAAN